jgi:hypothetical protein
MDLYSLYALGKEISKWGSIVFFLIFFGIAPLAILLDKEKDKEFLSNSKTISILGFLLLSLFGGALAVFVGLIIQLYAEEGLKKETLEKLKQAGIIEELYVEAESKTAECLSQLKECLKEKPSFEAGKCLDKAEDCCQRIKTSFKEGVVKTCTVFLENSNSSYPYQLVEKVCSSFVKEYVNKLYSSCEEKTNKLFLEFVQKKEKEKRN